MGRIMVSVQVQSVSAPEHAVRCDALVDTGASHLVLPSVWRERLGALDELETVEVETADQRAIQGVVCGPVRIQIEGFRPIYSEVLFVEMAPAHGVYEPLVGYIVLEQCQAAVDMLGHRLIRTRRLDLK